MYLQLAICVQCAVPGVYWQGVPNDHVCCHCMYLQSLPPVTPATARTRDRTGSWSKLYGRTSHGSRCGERIVTITHTRASKRLRHPDRDPWPPDDTFRVFFPVVATGLFIHPCVVVCSEAVIVCEEPRFTPTGRRDVTMTSDARPQDDLAVVAPGSTTLADHS